MSTKPVFQLRDVHHSFGTGALEKTVLHGVSAELFAGEIVLLTGPSGSGKTTILTLGGGLRRVQTGSVQVLGEELRGASQSTLLGVRQRIGFIFQAPNLLDALTACQNVALALAWAGPISAQEAEARALEQLELVGLGSHAHKLPGQLSGGQRQRVAIARALVVRPKIILADEPTSALDRQTGRDVVELLQRLARGSGCAILLVTHDHRILDIADRTLALEDGQLVSLARDAAQAASHLASGVAQIGKRTDLKRLIADLNEAEFFRFLKDSADELAHLREALESARSQVAASQFDQLLVATTYKAGQLLQADRVTLFVVDHRAGLLRSRVAQAGTENLLHIEIRLDQGIAGFVARTGETINLSDAYDDPMFNRDVDLRTGYRTRSLLCVAVKNASGLVVAVGQVLNKQGSNPFTEDDERRFSEFLEPIGRLLENLLAVEKPVSST